MGLGGGVVGLLRDDEHEAVKARGFLDRIAALGLAFGVLLVVICATERKHSVDE